MPKLNGLFDSFDNLDAINIDSLMTWLKNPPSNDQLENYLANKILYPGTLPTTDDEMKIDMAILREALKINSPSLSKASNALLGDNPFLNITLRKIIIPKRFLQYAPNLVSLTWAFVDGLLFNRRKEDWFEDLWTVVLSDDIDDIVGSVLLPQFEGLEDRMNLNVLDRNYTIKAGSLVVVPCSKNKCEVGYKFTKGKVLGNKESAIEVYGGELGIMIDGRI